MLEDYLSHRPLLKPLLAFVGVEFAGLNGRLYLDKDLADHHQAKSVVLYVVGSAMSSLDSVAHKVKTTNPNTTDPGVVPRRQAQLGPRVAGVSNAAMQGRECGDLCIGVPTVGCTPTH